MACALRGTESINHYFFENNRACAVVWGWAAELNRRKPPSLTLETLNTGVRQWLAGKGFGSDEAFNELEKLVGSLKRGLHVLLHSPPRQKRNQDRQHRDRCKAIPKYSQEHLHSARKFWKHNKQKPLIESGLEDDDRDEGHDQIPSVGRIKIPQGQLYEETKSANEVDKVEEWTEEFVEDLQISFDSAGIIDIETFVERPSGGQNTLASEATSC